MLAFLVSLVPGFPSDEGIYDFGLGLGPRLTVPASVKFLGFTVFVHFNSLTEATTVTLLVDEVAVASITVNPGQTGVILVPGFAQEVPPNSQVFFRAETALGQAGELHLVAATAVKVL